MAGTKEYTKEDLVQMASHLSRKNVPSYNRGELLIFVKEAVTSLKPRVTKITFAASVTFEAISKSLKKAGLELLSYAGSKTVFGISSGKKTGIKLVSITDATKKNRRKLVVYFGSSKVSSEVVELVSENKGTRTCGSQEQMQLVIDNAVIDKHGIDAICSEIARLASDTRNLRHEAMKQVAAEKAAKKVDSKFTNK